jgi:hypothetical protein
LQKKSLEGGGNLLQAEQGVFFLCEFCLHCNYGENFGLEVAANQALSSTTIIHGKGSVLLLLPHQCVILKD